MRRATSLRKSCATNAWTPSGRPSARPPTTTYARCTRCSAAGWAIRTPPSSGRLSGRSRTRRWRTGSWPGWPPVPWSRPAPWPTGAGSSGRILRTRPPSRTASGWGPPPSWISPRGDITASGIGCRPPGRRPLRPYPDIPIPGTCSSRRSARTGTLASPRWGRAAPCQLRPRHWSGTGYWLTDPGFRRSRSGRRSDTLWRTTTTWPRGCSRPPQGGRTGWRSRRSSSTPP